MNYEKLKNLLGHDIHYILDIGAHFGDFTMNMLSIYPNCKSIMIEANKVCESRLKNIPNSFYEIALLSDSEKYIDYYTNLDDPTSTGNSYYKEMSKFFSEEKTITNKLKSKTLDTMFLSNKFDLIKIDTQGSELDIIKGGKNLISKTKFILIECSIKEYNKHAPLVDDITEYMINSEFNKIDIVYNHYINGELFQQDILFKNIKI